MSRRKSKDTEVSVAPYVQEALLIDAIEEMAGRRVVCTSRGLAQFAEAAARAMPEAEVCCTYFDAYRARLAKEAWPIWPPNLTIACAADFPEGEADIVALPFAASGEAELTRDFLQAGHLRLRTGGRLYAATDNRKDSWLGEVMGQLFRKLERRRFAKGAMYVGTKTEPLKKVKDYGCEFVFRDRGRLIRAYSRPGVFSHRHIDPGARHLIEEMHVEPGARVLDVGCGAGTVALAAACRADGVHVHAVDANVRAVECTRRGAELNEFGNVTVELNAHGDYSGAGSFELAMANPPYYSGYRIARQFLEAGRAALREGGRMLVVAKAPEWYAENFGEWFEQVEVKERKGYFVFSGVRRRGRRLGG
ncbi:MAG: methyltransferase [Pirellulales bacterium]